MGVWSVPYEVEDRASLDAHVRAALTELLAYITPILKDWHNRRLALLKVLLPDPAEHHGKVVSGVQWQLGEDDGLGYTYTAVLEYEHVEIRADRTLANWSHGTGTMDVETFEEAAQMALQIKQAELQLRLTDITKKIQNGND